MKILVKSFGAALVSIGVCACASQPGPAYDHDLQKQFILGSATDQNIALQSIRATDVPNKRGLTGQSGERAAAAIARLNAGERAELSDASASGIGSTASE
ncbi:MAG: hypothetical protein ABJG15_02270 [Hyphomonadaceae bacterium]